MSFTDNPLLPPEPGLEPGAGSPASAPSPPPWRPGQEDPVWNLWDVLRIVAQGTPEQVARCRKSYTGQALAEYFARSPATGN